MKRAIWIPIMLLVVALPPLQAGTITASCSDFTVDFTGSPSASSSFSCGQFDSTLGVLTQLQFAGTLSAAQVNGSLRFVSSSGMSMPVGGDFDGSTTLSGITVGDSLFMEFEGGAMGQMPQCQLMGDGNYMCISNWIFDAPGPQTFPLDDITDPALLQTAVGTGDWSPSLSSTLSCEFTAPGGGDGCSSVTGSLSFTGITVQYDYSDAPPPGSVPEPATLITLASGIALLATIARQRLAARPVNH